MRGGTSKRSLGTTGVDYELLNSGKRVGLNKLMLPPPFLICKLFIMILILFSLSKLLLLYYFNMFRNTSPSFTKVNLFMPNANPTAI